ncbi:MAG: BatA and WFA domain-containing protein [Myxococcales bacterium]|nr:BatA and WFA domain-containing protein [Myxococcales bacterium]
MSFGQPQMLLFGLVALLPLVLHLIGRRKARAVSFSALAFLLAHDRRRARALVLEQRLLVALRMAIAGLVALALARPMLPDWSADAGLALGQGPVAVAIVLDDSLSMASRLGDQNRMFAAKKRARSLIAGLPAGSLALVVTSSRPARAMQPRLSADLRSVAADVDRHAVSSRPDDAASALRIARRLLADAPLKNRQIVVISDLQKGGWQILRRPPTAVSRVVVPVGTPVDDTEIVDVSVEPATDRGAQFVQVRVQLRRRGKTPWQGQVTLHLGDREVRQRVTVPAGEVMAHSFVVPAVADRAEVTLEHEGSQSFDGQPGNDRRHVLVGGGSTLRVLVVNGSPRPVPRDDETFFLVQGLAAGRQRADELRIDVTQSYSQQPWDVLVLANVAELSGAHVGEIRQRVAAGAGVLLTTGDAVAQAPSPWLHHLWPLPISNPSAACDVRLGSSRLGAQQPKTQALQRELGLTVLPAMRHGRVRRRLLLKPHSQLRSSTLVNYDDGVPAWVSVPYKKGKIALWTTSIDRDWSDLPMQTGWLAFVRQLIWTTAGRKATLGRRVVDSGAPVLLERKATDRELILLRGERRQRTIDITDQPPGLWRVKGLEQPGLWTLRVRSDKGSREAFVIVRPPATESVAQLDKAPDRSAASDGSGEAATPMMPAWSLALAALFGLLLAEALLLRRTSQ